MAAAKHEFLIILPDNAGVLEKRMSVRPYVYFPQPPSTRTWNNTLLKALLSITGGATLDAHPVADEGLKINGSVMLALAESKEEVLEQIKNDVYCKEGIWDMDKIQVIPVSRPVALQFDYKKLLEKVLMICE
ncbi:hypothetical protein MMC06_001639 [Schaereria dolodes]|nr:hypothetical protein [Schaereria dolodes]